MDDPVKRDIQPPFFSLCYLLRASIIIAGAIASGVVKLEVINVARDFVLCDQNAVQGFVGMFVYGGWRITAVCRRNGCG